MRHLISIILSCVIFTACQKQEPPKQTQQDNLVEFATELVTSKAMPKNEFTLGDQFFVYGVNTNEDDYTPNSPNGIDFVFNTKTSKGVAVTNFGLNSNGDDIWKYDDPVVWLPGKSTFFAFSPVPNGTQTYGITNFQNGFSITQVPSLKFTVAGGYDPATATPEQIADSRKYNKRHVDLIAAFNKNQVAGKITQLTFEHTLAQITFAVKPLQERGFIRIISVTMQNVMTSATLNLDHRGWDETSLNRKLNFALNLNHDVVSTIPANPDKIYPINDADETLMMIPQPLQNVSILVRYSYSEDGINWPDYNPGREVTVDLSKITSHWLQAKQYNFILAIDPTK